MDYDVNFEGRYTGRDAYRTRLPGLVAHLADDGREYEVLNLSASGLAVKSDGRSFARDETIVFDLVLSGVRILKAARARVVRVLGQDLAGCDFVGLSRDEESRLDKLILEVQKRLISARKRLEEERPAEDDGALAKPRPD
jgi:hypothetical protein